MLSSSARRPFRSESTWALASKKSVIGAGASVEREVDHRAERLDVEANGFYLAHVILHPPFDSK